MAGDAGNIIFENEFFYITHFYLPNEYYYYLKNNRHTIEEIPKEFAEYLIKIHKEKAELEHQLNRISKQRTLFEFWDNKEDEIWNSQ